MRYELTVNGQVVGSDDAEPDDSLIDFLYEQGLTGTRVACGIGACGSCKVAVQTAQGLSPVLACYAHLKSVKGLPITTVQGLARGGQLHPLQQKFLELYAFQCGYSTPGMLMTGVILIDKLERMGGVEARFLDREISAAMAGHICRCTGYVRYYQAIRDVITSWPQYKEWGDNQPLVIPDGSRKAQDKPPQEAVWFRVTKRSRNDVQDKILEGRFENPAAKLTLTRPLGWDGCSGEVKVKVDNLRTGEPIRDLNLRRFLFAGVGEIVFTLEKVEPLDSRPAGEGLPAGLTLPLRVSGRLAVGSTFVPITAEVTMTAGRSHSLRVQSREPVRVPLKDLGLPVADFMAEFGLKLGDEIEFGLDNLEVDLTTVDP